LLAGCHDHHLLEWVNATPQEQVPSNSNISLGRLKIIASWFTRVPSPQNNGADDDVVSQSLDRLRQGLQYEQVSKKKERRTGVVGLCSQPKIGLESKRMAVSPRANTISNQGKASNLRSNTSMFGVPTPAMCVRNSTGLPSVEQRLTRYRIPAFGT
jgi:hypothetical protein